jgi:hypothetical protein
VISGTPTTQGSYAFALKVADTATHTAVKSFSVYIENIGPLSVSPGSPLSAGTQGTAYSNTITASGGTAPYTFTYLPDSGGSPAPFNTLSQGITFTPATPAVNLGGTPTVPGSYVFRLLVKDSAGHSLVQSYTLTILASSLTVITQNLPQATVNSPYVTSIAVDGGTSPYAFTYTAGSLDAQTGMSTATPTPHSTAMRAT